MNSSQSDTNLAYISWKAWGQESFGVVTSKDALVYSCELRRAKVTLRGSSSVLEIGFGNGAFAGWVRRQTAHYIGTEINPELIARARQAGIEAHQATLDLDTLPRTGPFDLIAMFDVLEHMEKSEIINVLKAASRCLSPEGRIIIRVPSGDSPFAGHLMNGDLTHKTSLGRFAFYQLASLTGMEVTSVHDAAFPIFGLGSATAIRRLVVASARKLVEFFVRNIYYANEPVVLAPTLVAVLQLRSSEVTAVQEDAATITHSGDRAFTAPSTRSEIL